MTRSCRVLHANIRGLHENLRDLCLASFSMDVVLLSETLVEDRRYESELKMSGHKGHST